MGYNYLLCGNIADAFRTTFQQVFWNLVSDIGKRRIFHQKNHNISQKIEILAEKKHDLIW